MNVYGIVHEAKSKYAYQASDDTLHIRLKTAVGDIKAVSLVYGDPFFWEKGQWQIEKNVPLAMHLEFSDQLYDYWFVAVKPSFKRMRYAFLLDETHVFDAKGVVSLKTHPEAYKNLRYFFNFPYLNEEDRFKAPSWVKDTVWYQIFPERYANGDSRLNLKGTLPWNSKKEVTNEMLFGGDLQGVIDHLDDIKALGITGIYFTPIFKASTTHKYDTEDYYQIDPAFGTNETFKRLVDEAHARGIKIMLDAVFNHCGFKHPYFQDVVKKGFDSDYAQCFHLLREPVINFPLTKEGFPNGKGLNFNGTLNYETFAFTPNMPKWRTGNPKAEAYLLDVARYWIEHYDIDGWRLDVSNEVSHVFWRKFKSTVEAVKPDVFILGENWDNADPWLKGDQFHSVMNYEFTYAVWQLLGNEEGTADFGAQAYKEAIGHLMATYPEPVAENLFTLLDSHDTSRIMTLLGGNENKVKCAFVLQMTFPGCPSVYYGSEIGLMGVNDGNRVCMPWEDMPQASSLKAHVAFLIDMRKKYPAMKSTHFRWFDLPDSKGILAYEKISKGERILVAINLLDQAQTVTLDGERLVLEAFGFWIEVR